MSSDDQKTPKSVRVADLLLKKQLPIMVRPTDSQGPQSSLEGNVNEDSMGSGSSSRLPTSQSSSRRGTRLVHGTGWQSPPATPPPVPVSRTGSQLINGIGCRFPTGLLSRASTLTVDGESVTDILATGRDVLDPRSSPSAFQEDLLNTPRPEASSFETPTVSGPARESIFGSLPLLTPRLTPNRKRSSSPPSAPRPAKRQKVDTREAEDDVEESVYQGEDFQGLAIDRTFHNARRLTLDLMETTGCSISKPGAGEETSGRGNSSGHTTPSSPRTGRVDRASEAGDFSSSETVSAKRVHWLNYSIKVESFSEEEIQRHLAELLSAYRAFFLEPDEEEPPQPRDAESAERSRGILRTIFGHQLGSAENEDFLLQGEEEDVLDVLLTWICENHMTSRDRHGPFEDPAACLVRLDDIATIPFVKNILLSAHTPDGSMFTVQLPGCSLEGTVSWQMGNIHHSFLLEIEELDIA